ncbi:pali-domain-containing protein [Dentipellis sp. KUC8613]|nr:pali-domain-containing protein [Dentipellis sp. KUC8613]
MGIIRPATPGFLVTLLATILLAVVSFSVPYFKSVYFLKASLAVEGLDGSITFGTLGFCTHLPNGTTCSKASVGYSLDINKLVGDNTSIQIPNVLVKWITYALVLHIVALALAGISAIFGLLAHIREFSMTCFSTCISGFGAAITLLAFIFDLAFFFIAKSRINKVKGGSASMGNAIWLTLAAWLLLFFAGCFYGLGRCCASRRPRNDDRNQAWMPRSGPQGSTYEDQMRLDAVKAEADRKARQKQGEIGLPAFNEYDPTEPLTSGDEEQGHYHDHAAIGTAVGGGAAPYNQGRQRSQSGNRGGYAGGYAQATPGTRAVDEYYAPSNQPAATSYPPQPRRQPTTSSAHTQAASGYAPSVAAPVPTVAAAGFAAAGAQYGHQQYSTQGAQYGHDQYASNTNYNQAPAPSAYNAGPSHQQYASNAAYNDPFAAYQPPQEPPLNPDVYNSSALLYGVSSTPAPQHYTPPPTHYTPPPAHAQDASAYYAQPAPQSPPQRSYTLGGGGYGGSVVPDLHGGVSEPSTPGYLPYPGSATQTAPIATNVSPVGGPVSPRGARPMPSSSQEQYEDSPPVYDDATAQPAGQWGSKR